MSTLVETAPGSKTRLRTGRILATSVLGAILLTGYWPCWFGRGCTCAKTACARWCL